MKEFKTDAFKKAIYDKRCDGNYRTAKHSMRAVCGLIGVSINTLSRLERGSMPDLMTYVKICDWLGVSTETFFEENAPDEEINYRAIERVKAELDNQ